MEQSGSDEFCSEVRERINLWVDIALVRVSNTFMKLVHHSGWRGFGFLNGKMT